MHELTKCTYWIYCKLFLQKGVCKNHKQMLQAWTSTQRRAVHGPDPPLTTLQESNTCDLLYLKLSHHLISPPFIAYAIFISFGCLSTGLLCLKLAVLHRCCFWASWVPLWVLCMQGAVVCVICCTWILTVYNICASHCTCLCL